MRKKHGEHGITKYCNTSPSQLSFKEISELKNGDRIIITWDGGNGPHEYEIRNDIDSWERYHSLTNVIRIKDLLDYDGISAYISRPD